ncbi:glycogen debranching protein GlgX [Sphingosinicella sp. BN140058]|uniref:glycogen debranching protein GlgX n=1 Tax=Sphingosinicella sp. BN140058 TaxID=1892855 RepID=UPI001012487F|nr:glycogen debranching protein GlgX [Sphingosinicella sp. BN140058]QAY77605.1 glycogen debranching enzyme GlgX [Sphingosinicella sp. BN140058]
MTIRPGEGRAEPLGVTLGGDGVNVAIFSAHADAIDFCLFDDAGAKEVERVRLAGRTGDVHHAWIPGVGVGARYGLRAHGPWAPAAGHRFNSAKLLVDPHARVLDRGFVLHPSMFGHDAAGGPDGQDSAPFMPKGIVTETPPPFGLSLSKPFLSSSSPREKKEGASTSSARTGANVNGKGSRSLPVPWSETILYELHVRGFTMRHGDVPPAVRGTFAGLASPAAIDHLVRLGITSVEILPAAAWIDERHLGPLGLTNYWGYNPVAFLAPDPRLAPGGWPEIAAAVAALAAAGIETIVDVVYNHSGEGDALGPTLSLRGLDNATYYRLQADDPAAYVDDSGTGNTLALDRAPVVRLVMDALRCWARAGVHGFRFDLATCLGRRPDGFDPQAPLLAAIEQDPELRGLKLIAEAWDIGPGGYQVGRFGGAWGEWNDRFRDDVRRFWRGDPHRLGSLATRLAGSADLFAAKRRPSRGINFVTAHDGFTLADLVAHSEKHNHANGEDNRDGSNENFSWNNGAEGATDVPAIRAARLHDQRALIATLLLARGTPMLSMGAELGHSQSGNNNAYAQDNEGSWIDWDRSDESLRAFTQRLIALRHAYPVLRQDRFLTGEGDVQWLTPLGAAMTPNDWESGDGMAMLLGHAGERLALLVNGGREARTFVLPEARTDLDWRVLADSNPEERDFHEGGPEFAVAGRSLLLVAEEPR